MASKLEELIQEAETANRLRKNFNYHNLLSDPINRMLNAFECDTYCRPHKHENPDKREVFIVLKGRLGLILFNSDGTILSSNQLSPYPGNPGAEIPPGVWHMVVALEPGTVVYEIKDGPYKPEIDKNFASWAPAEGDQGCKAYLKEIMTKARF